MNLEKVFEFIKEKRGYDYPTIYKLINGVPLNDDELYFKDDLELTNKNIRFLPDNLKFNSDLYLDDNPLLSLPNNLYVNGDLNLSGTKITSLPDNLTIRGNLFLEETPLSKKYGEEEIRKMIEDKGGSVGWNIWV